MVSDVPVSSTSDIELRLKLMNSVAYAMFAHAITNSKLIIFLVI